MWETKENAIGKDGILYIVYLLGDLYKDVDIYTVLMVFESNVSRT